MPDLRPEERWAAACIRATLDCEVTQHDDGSGPGMYDLDIAYADGRTGAVEVTSATHAEETEFWKLATSGERWIEPGLAGGWVVYARTSARVRSLRAALPGLLAVLERRRATHLTDHRATDLDERWAALGVVSARQSGTDFPGSIYLLPWLPAEETGGVVPDHSDGLPAWLTTWVANPDCGDNLDKLRDAVDADERHLFVFVPAFSTAPFDVQYVLLDDGRPLPHIAPGVSEHLTDVWVTGTMTAGLGYRWTRGQGWSYFDRCIAGPQT